MLALEVPAIKDEAGSAAVAIGRAYGNPGGAFCKQR